jgi:ATP-dependent RNA helicase HelY
VVILDEVHYLQDPFRGAVWEEVIIHAPAHLQLMSLSATVENAVEFSEWVESRRGITDLVVAGERPVPLEAQYMLKDRHSHDDHPPAHLRSPGRESDDPTPVSSGCSASSGGARDVSSPRRHEVIEVCGRRGCCP